MSKNKLRLHNEVIKKEFDGLLHRIPCEIYVSDTTDIGVLILSPDPDWNADMYHKTCDELFFNLVKNEISVLRFDYKKSYENSIGSRNYDAFVQQANLALEALILQSENMLSKFILVGVNMGSYIARSVQLRRPEVVASILVSPCFAHYDFRNLQRKNTLQYLFVGDKDEYVCKNQSDSESLLTSYIKNCNIDQDNNLWKIKDCTANTAILPENIHTKLINNIINTIHDIVILINKEEYQNIE